MKIADTLTTTVFEQYHQLCIIVSHPVVIWDHTIQPNNRVYITEVCFAEHTACHGRAIVRVSWTPAWDTKTIQWITYCSKVGSDASGLHWSQKEMKTYIS